MIHRKPSYRSKLPAARILSFFVVFFLLMVCGVRASSAATPAAQDSTRIRWVAAQGAQVKMGGKIPIMWNLYQPDKKEKKKDNLALVQLGRRYLLLDMKARLVYEVKLSALQPEGKDFTSDDLAATSRLIPTTDWMIRDVGPAELIDLTLDDYGGALEVQVPHPLILTPPVHYF
jgi:hypothetical protein